MQLPIKQNIIWQDDQEPLAKLIVSKQNWYDKNITDKIETWKNEVFNLKTATAFGCVVWAKILGIPPGLVYIPSKPFKTPFGSINEKLTPRVNGVFSSELNNNFSGDSVNPKGANFFEDRSKADLTVDEMRRLLRMRYYAQTMSPTATNINYALKDVFGDLGAAYVSPTSEAMVIDYIFQFSLSEKFKLHLQKYLPRGAGVLVTVTAN